MAKVSFTVGRVEAFECEPGKQQSILWDSKTPCLGLRATAGGAKSYIFETRIHGKTVRITIGDVRTWMLNKAQQKASEYKVLADQGIDPREVKAEKRQRAEEELKEERRREVTFATVWAEYIEANKSHWGARHIQDHNKAVVRAGQPYKRTKGSTVDALLVHFLDKPLSYITRETLIEWIEREKPLRPRSLLNTFILLRAFINWVSQHEVYRGVVEEECYKAPVVRRALPKPAVKNDSLQKEQLKAWFEGIHSLTNSSMRTYFIGLLITGARKEELMQLKWEDVQFEWSQLTIRDKVEGTRVIPLTPYFAKLLLLHHERNGSPTKGWVFTSGRSKSGRLISPRKAHTEVLEKAGLPHLTIHGLRRSFGTLCEWVEVPAGVSAQIMGHKPSAIAERHYRARPIDLLRVHHTRIEKWLLRQAGVEFEYEVEVQ